MTAEMIHQHIKDLDKRLELNGRGTGGHTGEVSAALLQAKSTALLALAQLGEGKPRYEVRTGGSVIYGDHLP